MGAGTIPSSLSLFCRAVLALSGAIASYGIASASDRPSDPSSEIVVTARKRAEKAADVPIALSTATGATLDGRRLDQIEDLKQLSPSLNISYFNPRGNYVSIRGLGRNPASDGLEPAVGMFIDGVYLGRPGMAAIDLIDIDSVEILRGPQGTLFGKNTTAGAIVFTTRPPVFSPEARIEATIGTNGYAQLRADAAGALVDHRLAARIAVYHTRQGGWVQPLVGDRLNGKDRTGVRLQLLFQPNDDTRLRLIADHHTEDDNCCTLVAGSFGPPSATYLSRVALADGTAILGGAEYRTTVNAPTFLRVYQGGVSATLTHDFAAAELTSISAYRQWHYRAGFDGDLSSAEGYRSAAVPTDDWQFSQEVRFANPVGAKVDWVAGLYYFRQELRSTLELAFAGRAANFLTNSATPPPALLAFDNLVSATGAILDTEAMAAFGQISWHIDPRLALTVGARMTYERKSGSIDRPANAAQLAYRQTLAIADVDPSGTIALAYAPTPQLHLYASYARGTKAGGINPIVATSAADQIVRPEYADSFELGLKATLLAGRAHLNISLFYTRILDYQATINRLFGAVLTNVGRVSTRGVEVEGDWRVTRSLVITAAGSHNDAHYDRYDNAPCPPENIGVLTCDLSGAPLADAPRWIVNTSVRYTRSIGQLGEAWVAFDYGYRSPYFGNIDNSAYSKLGDVGIANAQFGLDLNQSRWALLLWIKNFSDVRYLQSYPLGGSTIYGGYFGTIGQPRSAGLTISRRF